MKRLLDNRLERQKNLLEELWNYEWVSLYGLSEKLGVTDKTIKSDIESMNMYIQPFRIECTSNFEVGLIKDDSLSKYHLYSKILSHSNSFSILETVFFESCTSFEAIGIKTYLSSSHVKRLIESMNEILEKFDVKISPELELVGNQRAICQIMLNYLFEKYSSLESLIGERKSMIIESLIIEFYSSNEHLRLNQPNRQCLLNKMKLQVYLMMERVRKGYLIFDKIPECPFYNPETLLDKFRSQFLSEFKFELNKNTLSQIFHVYFLPYSKECHIAMGMSEQDFLETPKVISDLRTFFCSLEEKLGKKFAQKERLINDIYWSSLHTLGPNYVLHNRDKDFFLALKSRYPEIAVLFKEKLTDIYSRYTQFHKHDISEMVYNAIFMIVNYWDDLLESIEKEAIVITVALVMTSNMEHLSSLKKDIEYQFREKIKVRIFDSNSVKQLYSVSYIDAVITDGTIPEIYDHPVTTISISDILDQDSVRKLVKLYLRAVKKTSNVSKILA